MTEFDTQDPASAPPAKEPAPGLNARAARPHAVRLRKSVVQMTVIGGAVLVSGSLAWAFVIQPEMRDAARIRTAEDREDNARGSVRPTEVVTGQPATYDRLPEPRGAEIEPEYTAAEATARPVRTEAAYAASYRTQPPARPAGPSARQLAAQSGLFFAQGPGAESGIARTAPPQARTARMDPDLGAMYGGHSLVAPLSPFELKAGAIVPAALLTAVDTSRAGPVVATVTQNVYDSISGRHLLLPQGTRLIGTSQGESAYGDRRAFLTWDRLILPNGKSLLLTSEAGVDAQGAVGVRGQVDRRLFPLLVGTLFAGAITTLGQVARDGERGSGGLLGDAGDAAAIEGSQVGGRLVDRELGVRPSIRLRAGAAVRVMITRDLILEPYKS
ncbi:TrbI/VirB10 family protein [Brevundimonas sp.]|uniref:TrbI/VirB10 family protein n=1 Tax=Brevundimonas sp. TaxID=1871086 RepID=UPI0025B7DD39|nr:TrbI/VirB10 family protein [Brevundimonas sp.]